MPAEHSARWNVAGEAEADGFADDPSDRQLAEWEEQSYKDQILFVIDGHDSMYELNPRTKMPYIHQAFEAAFKVMNKKIISSPSDKVGVMVYGTGATQTPEMNTQKTMRFSQQHFLYLPIDQVSVEGRQQLKFDLARSKEDPQFFRKTFGKRKEGFTTSSAISNLRNLFAQSGKAGTKRVFWITNEDRPHKRDLRLQHQRAVEAIKTAKRIGIEFEPYLMGKDDQRFDINSFYAELFDQYDDEVPDINRDTRDERLQRQRKPWDWAVHEADLESEITGRETPKRTTFCIDFELAPNWCIGIKGYSTIMPARNSDAVWFYEDDDGVAQEAYSKSTYEDASTGKRLSESDRYKAFSFGETMETSRKIEFTPEEMNEAKTLGMSPSLRLIGTLPQNRLKVWHNISHASFIYPAEQNYTGSRCTFAAFHASLLKKDKIALGLLCPRKDTSPYFVALLPQKEEVDEGGMQLVAPGMHCIRLPFADDIRNVPVGEQLSANHASVDAAKELIRKLTKKWPYDPKDYPNPTLAMHYAALQRVAYAETAEEIPDPHDATLPKHDRQRQLAGPAIAQLNECIEDDPRSHRVFCSGKGSAVPDEIDEQHTKSLWINDELHTLLAKDLKELCKRMGVACVMKKAPMIIAIHNRMMEMYPEDVQAHQIKPRVVEPADD
ncbi:SPOC domain-like protein [Tilletiaria anomala UBC 951]|uniref:ATP-dependent DNA helicase II subunit 1 n=1 Tax=Tilletiaria anomala (strain ATCC 24038 / CBS 436.72 / UBC 951) TaxID=1037660 RepID=A0A066WDP8_TILAU|nr:SPOC domain-like protein [Tilletiaria anomala UBC 951]KDN49229.1 SPOC domain-like protein [Tilletiaria anomala UBC 951]